MVLILYNHTILPQSILLLVVQAFATALIIFAPIAKCLTTVFIEMLNLCVVAS